MTTKRFAGRIESLIKIGEFVRHSAKDAGLSDSEIYDVELAVDEACTNIIEHAYHNQGTQEIICTCEPLSDAFKVVVLDEGCEYDPNQQPLPQLGVRLEDLKNRGVGVYLMHQVLDEVQHEYFVGQGNRLTLIKRRVS